MGSVLQYQFLNIHIHILFKYINIKRVLKMWVKYIQNYILVIFPVIRKSSIVWIFPFVVPRFIKSFVHIHASIKSNFYKKLLQRAAWNLNLYFICYYYQQSYVYKYQKIGKLSRSTIVLDKVKSNRVLKHVIKYFLKKIKYRKCKFFTIHYCPIIRYYWKFIKSLLCNK